MQLTIYHNPRCSKSRKTLELIKENGHEPMIVEYLVTPPDAATILALANRVGVAVATLMRTGEADYESASDLPDAGDDAALAEWLTRHPIVLQRPIVTDGSRAIIGRPPENVLALLEA